MRNSMERSSSGKPRRRGWLGHLLRIFDGRGFQTRTEVRSAFGSLVIAAQYPALDEPNVFLSLSSVSSVNMLNSPRRSSLNSMPRQSRCVCALLISGSNTLPSTALHSLPRATYSPLDIQRATVEPSTPAYFNGRYRLVPRMIRIRFIVVLALVSRLLGSTLRACTAAGAGRISKTLGKRISATDHHRRVAPGTLHRLKLSCNHRPHPRLSSKWNDTILRRSRLQAHNLPLTSVQEVAA